MFSSDGHGGVDDDGDDHGRCGLEAEGRVEVGLRMGWRFIAICDPMI